MSCRVEGLGTMGLAKLKARTADPEQALQELAQRGVDPDIFHLESIDRFAALTAEGCSGKELRGLDRFAEATSRRVRQMPIVYLKDRLTVLYGRAYIYSPRTGAMVLGPEPQQQSAKQDLDYLIAAIDRAAFNDELFLAALLDEPAIRFIMTLNSPRLLPKERGALHRLWQLTDRGAPEDWLLKELERQGVTRVQDFFVWFENYDGTGPFWETPWMRSQLEYDTAAAALLGEDRYRDLSLGTYPRGEYERLISQAGMGFPYQRLRRLSVEQLFQGAQEDLALLRLHQPPEAARNLVQELHLILFVLQERGLDRWSVIGWGWDYPLVWLRIGATPPGEGSLPLDPGRRNLQMTTHRLDEYQARFALLAGYHILYERLFVGPPAKHLGPGHLEQYHLWQHGFFNRTVTGVPLLLEDLNRVRYEVQQERLSWPVARAVSLVSPQELGICGETREGPLTPTRTLRYGDGTVEELICRNLEFIAFLPEEERPYWLDDAAATSLSLFGVAVFFDTQAEWTEGLKSPYFIESVAHEASHIEWFRENLERFPRRLLWSGVDERRAYAIGLEILTQLRDQEPDLERQMDYLGRMITYWELLTLTNARLGLPEFDFAPETTTPHWETLPVEDLIFQPPDLRQRR